VPDEPLPPPDTVLGAFVRGIEAKMAALEDGVVSNAPVESGSVDSETPSATSIDSSDRPEAHRADVGSAAAEELAELREVLRLGRHLLEGRQVTL
jgi:hypothetical protein